MAADPTSQVPVVIAGAGPAGLVAAVTLARNGVRSLLVERDQGLSPLPRATAVSTRTMELLRSWGLEDQVRAGQLDLNSTGAWAAETLASPDGVELPLGVAGIEQAAAASPTTLAAVPQDHLEPVLLGHLETLGLTEIQFGTELTALGQDADGVTVTLRQRAGGAERAVRAGYLVGADGAHSAARRLLDIAMDGPDHLNEQLTVLFEAPLGEVVGDRRHGIYFIQHPEAGGVLVPNGAGDRWLYGRGWDPPRERLEDYTDARLAGLIRAAAGVGDLPVRVVARGAFSFAAQVAERYREGRAFLAGDAAQRMTPRGGMGMNTAVAEAHDLAWKLAWVLNGWAGAGLLGGYEAEWRPIGARRTARSAKEGAEPDGAEALAEDLNGRLPHAWVPSADGHPRSTLDLLGPVLTLLIGLGPGAGAWPGAAAALTSRSRSPSTPSTRRPPPPWASTRTAPSWPAPTPRWSPTGPPPRPTRRPPSARSRPPGPAASRRWWADRPPPEVPVLGGRSPLAGAVAGCDSRVVDRTEGGHGQHRAVVASAGRRRPVRPAERACLRSRARAPRAETAARPVPLRARGARPRGTVRDRERLADP
jgi:putative polyketide hydroxylase